MGSTPATDSNADWPARFKKGDVVRGNGVLGVVLAVVEHPGPPRWWELHVDGPDGVAVWPPELTIIDTRPASLEEARRLGLRGLDPAAEAAWQRERTARILPRRERQRLVRLALADQANTGHDEDHQG